jgi:hypothetical protein
LNGPSSPNNIGHRQLRGGGKVLFPTFFLSPLIVRLLVELLGENILIMMSDTLLWLREEFFRLFCVFYCFGRIFAYLDERRERRTPRGAIPEQEYKFEKFVIENYGLRREPVMT